MSRRCACSLHANSQEVLHRMLCRLTKELSWRDFSQAGARVFEGKELRSACLPQRAVRRHQTRAQDGQEGVVREVQVLLVQPLLRLRAVFHRTWAESESQV